jgi:hypothetical protein
VIDLLECYLAMLLMFHTPTTVHSDCLSARSCCYTEALEVHHDLGVVLSRRSRLGHTISHTFVDLLAIEALIINEVQRGGGGGGGGLHARSYRRVDSCVTAAYRRCIHAKQAWESVPPSATRQLVFLVTDCSLSLLSPTPVCVDCKSASCSA